MSDCNHKFGHILNIGDGTGYYMCPLCDMEISEDHYAALTEIQRLRESLIFYGAEENYYIRSSITTTGTSSVDADCGAPARAALEI